MVGVAVVEADLVVAEAVIVGVAVDVARFVVEAVVWAAVPLSALFRARFVAATLG